jgi:hypothetical protein
MNIFTLLLQKMARYIEKDTVFTFVIYTSTLFCNSNQGQNNSDVRSSLATERLCVDKRRRRIQEPQGRSSLYFGPSEPF